MTPLAPVPDEACSLWRIEDVAKYLKTSRSWVYQRAGTMDGIPVMRVGGLLRFEPDEVKAWARGERKNTNVVTLKRAP